jgi:CheY-like chemotaxis protein
VLLARLEVLFDVSLDCLDERVEGLQRASSMLRAGRADAPGGDAHGEGTCEGHGVRVAHDGMEGLQRLSDSGVDLILLDVDMPRMSGPEMAFTASIRDARLEAIPGPPTAPAELRVCVQVVDESQRAI